MIGIWGFNRVTLKWFLWDEVKQDVCEAAVDRLRQHFPCSAFMVARRRPTRVLS